MGKKKWDARSAKNDPVVDLSDLLDEPPAGPGPAGAKLASFEPEQIGPPEATILFWAEYHCACGNVFDGPLLDSPVLVRHALLKHVCFGRYKPNGYIYRPATAETQFLQAEVHWEQKQIPKCIKCANSALVPDMHRMEDAQAREKQMHETARNEELRALEQHRLELQRADEADLKGWEREQLREARHRETAQLFQDLEPRSN
jgi:hypothetical protein